MLIIFSAGYSETFPLNLRMLGPTHLFSFPIVGLCFVSKTMCAIVEIDGVLQYFLILATQRNHLRGISRCYIALYLFADKPGNGNKQVNIVRFPRKHSLQQFQTAALTVTQTCDTDDPETKHEYDKALSIVHAVVIIVIFIC